MDIKEQVIKFMELKGPVLPVQIAKEIGSNILMASAHLAELSSNKKIKVSSLKVGSSPLYYLPGQESRLQQFVDNLPAKEKEAYNLLKQKNILRDSKAEPSIRVALRQIKDFAVPLQVNYKGSTEIFWRWFLTTGEEASKIIKSELKPEIKKKVEPKEIQKELKELKEKKRIVREVKPDLFLEQIKNYFKRNNIQIVEEKLLRKNIEYNFIVKLPSSVGELSYFCVAKSKKRVNDGDLSSSFIHAQSRKLPVLFLTKGSLTKKAKEMLEKEFKGMNVKRV